MPAHAPARRRTPPRSDREQLRRFAATHDPALRDDLIERYLPLARAVARRYASNGASLEDLTQVAAVALVKAVDRYDPQRGSRFSSFAVPTMTGEVRRHFRDRRWMIRPPRSLQERALEVAHATDDLTGRFGRQPTVAQLGDALGLSEREVLDAMEARLSMSVESLSVPRAGRDGEQDPPAERLGSPDAGYDRAEARATLERHARQLTRRERTVLLLRFQHDLTQQQIGAAVGLSQMQVSRVLRGAVSRLGELATAPAGDVTRPRRRAGAREPRAAG